jgi:hypothetical protein
VSPRLRSASQSCAPLVSRVYCGRIEPPHITRFEPGHHGGWPLAQSSQLLETQLTLVINKNTYPSLRYVIFCRRSAESALPQF